MMLDKRELRDFARSCAGKGSKVRPFDRKKWESGWDYYVKKMRVGREKSSGLAHNQTKTGQYRYPLPTGE